MVNGSNKVVSASAVISKAGEWKSLEWIPWAFIPVLPLTTFVSLDKVLYLLDVFGHLRDGTYRQYHILGLSQFPGLCDSMFLRRVAT